jgi:hypothetical protein
MGTTEGADTIAATGIIVAGAATITLANGVTGITTGIGIAHPGTPTTTGTITRRLQRTVTPRRRP